MAIAEEIRVGSRLFLTAAPDLEPGHELQSGHWSSEVGRWPLARRDDDGLVMLERDAIHVLLELTWETVRLREFPDRPSHLVALFLWTGEAPARAWHYRKHTLRRSNAGLYEVEVVTCERAFAADMNWISIMEPGDTLATLWERARQYWRGEGADSVPEVLLEGRVAVRRDLLAIPLLSLELVADELPNQKVAAAVGWVGPDSEESALTPVRASRYHLQTTLASDPQLPVRLAGWAAVEIEGQAEPILARQGTPPVLVRPGETCPIRVAVTDLSPLPKGARFRPVLICNRAAAHYWQLQTYWEGRIPGEWQKVDGVRRPAAGSSEQTPPPAASAGSGGNPQR